MAARETTGHEEATGAAHRDGKGLMQLLRDLRDEARGILRLEVTLAKTELAEKNERSLHQMMRVAAGGLLAVAGLIVLLIGLSTLLAAGLESAGLSPEVAVWLGPVLVGALVLIIGWGLTVAGKRGLRREARLPRNTMASLKETEEWAREKVKP
jgi:xanthine/uracil permease